MDRAFSTNGQVELRLSGTGGQGLILAGIILSEAATDEGRHVLQTQSYGPESRGGASKAEVIVSDRPIHYPEVLRPDILLVMSQTACDRHCGVVKPDGLQLVDSYYVTDVPTGPGTVYAIPFSEIAIEEAGGEIFANIVGLGALQATSRLVSESALERAVARRVPPRTIEQNLRALSLGVDAALAVAGIPEVSPSRPTP